MQVMSGKQASDAAIFELRFEPTVALVATIRRFVSEFYGELLGNRDVADNLGMATHEMLENATAYSNDRKSEMTIAARHDGVRVEITIQTKNRATPERLAKVRKALDEVVTATDPEALYMTLVHRAAKRRDGGSGLGLGRIRAEADMALEYVIAGDMLTVTAQGAFLPSTGRETGQEAG